MRTAQDKFYWLVNPLLGLLAALNIALTLYACTRFYAHLPTSDTWVHIQFLAQAAQGQLSISDLLEKHNGVHLIALPKLVYFLDMWITRGSGVMVVGISLLAQCASALIGVVLIQRIENLPPSEKLFLSLVSVVCLLSACQVESFLNPANLQWSLLVFSASFTAWFMGAWFQQRSLKHVMGVIAGVALITTTSASVLFGLVPIGLLMIGRRMAWRIACGGLLAALVVGILLSMKLADGNAISTFASLLKNWLKFSVDFFMPPVERLNSLWVSVVAGLLISVALLKLSKFEYSSGSKSLMSILFLFWFSLFAIFVTGVARSYSPAAFTFRFVNIGLLFSLSVFILCYLQVSQGPRRILLAVIGFLYLCLLSSINILEVATFGFGRNHVRLNQVAYALDIRNSYVVSALPGTIWEKQDYDFVQAHKQELRENAVGIYSSQSYLQLGKKVSDLHAAPLQTACTTQILKARRLLSDQAAYKLTGHTQTESGKTLSKVYFVDEAGVIRGFAIPILSSRSLWRSLQQGDDWSGFVNLDAVADVESAQISIQIYAYDDEVRCAPQRVELPAYEPFVKKQKRPLGVE